MALIRIMSVILIVNAATSFVQTANTAAQERPALKAIVHVNFSEAERQEAGLKNIDNILRESPKAQVEVVCHGEAERRDIVQVLADLRQERLDSRDLLGGEGHVSIFASIDVGSRARVHIWTGRKSNAVISLLVRQERRRFRASVY